MYITACINIRHKLQHAYVFATKCTCIHQDAHMDHEVRVRSSRGKPDTSFVKMMSSALHCIRVPITHMTCYELITSSTHGFAYPARLRCSFFDLHQRPSHAMHRHASNLRASLEVIEVNHHRFAAMRCRLHHHSIAPACACVYAASMRCMCASDSTSCIYLHHKPRLLGVHDALHTDMDSS